MFLTRSQINLASRRLNPSAILDELARTSPESELQQSHWYSRTCAMTSDDGGPRCGVRNRSGTRAVEEVYLASEA